MPDLLLEVGCEELPASFVRSACADLQAAIGDALAGAGVAAGASSTLSTPRRLIVSVQGVAAMQPDQEKVLRGPGVKAAYDASGAPTGALQGFCRGQGAQPEDAYVEGEYVWLKVATKGRPVADLLTEILPAAIQGLSFPKAMRWGTYRMRFARPIRWVLASFGGEAVPFEIGPVKSGLASRGHRFTSPEPFEARTLDALIDGLIARQVEPDPAERVARIREGVVVASGGTVDVDEGLVEENAYLTEWPSAVEGTFGEEFLELPEPVLVTVMAKHERFFPVRGRDGKLINRFVSIRNGGDAATVAAGNAWVVNARFNDARFFFEEDKRYGLAEFLERTEGIVFQEKLGTVRRRADRLSALCTALVGSENASLAGLYAKADLSTGLVSELPELQGSVGAEYARREGMPEAVCFALERQYALGDLAKADAESRALALGLALADSLDKLAGYLGLGLVPSGSSDPYALRRAAGTVVECGRLWPNDALRVFEAFREALGAYTAQGVAVDADGAVAALADLVVGRYEALFADARHDVLQAALLQDSPQALLDPRSVEFRVRACEAAAAQPALATAATRPLNIVDAARKKGVAFVAQGALEHLNDADLDSADGVALAAAARQTAGQLAQAVAGRDAQAAVGCLQALAEPINAFFDSTMVMVDDERVRSARLTLLAACCEQIRHVGNLSLLAV